MRILVCAAYVPYPPRGGGRADIWRRIEALTRLGHSVMLLHQYDTVGPLAPTSADFEQMDRVLASRYSYRIRRGRLRTLRQLLGMARLPWHAAKAVLSGGDGEAALEAIRRFEPELVWLDGPWPGEVARRAAERWRIPLVYRSHNVEHEYLRRQAAASPSIRNRIAWRLAGVGVKRYEMGLMREADHVADISLADLEYWRAQGISSISWLPPLPELALTSRPARTVSSDILFVGGLSLPNNVTGVRWLIGDVLPLLHRARPELTLTVVGSSPRGPLRAELEAHPAVRSYFDVPSVNPYLFGARVLVNPVSVGSGVQLKMLDMLMTDAPIVARGQGVRGLPDDFAALCDVADTAAGFAESILARLDDPRVDLAARGRVRRRFEVAAVGDCLERVASEGRRSGEAGPGIGASSGQR
ncbi:glycosyltransferase [Leucobacter sp. wl10]|uniref:glycosyltransferase n=1 Tax=Leucobacter sp. wl10 TaxID=2304677 RepID=UPI000E5BD276|nr:glycosyltransferase [Leucobacter sp. wl10]RGE16227.1 glycosyltransferase [Leucobacter sp. wl10]